MYLLTPKRPFVYHDGEGRTWDFRDKKTQQVPDEVWAAEFVKAYSDAVPVAEPETKAPSKRRASRGKNGGSADG